MNDTRINGSDGDYPPGRMPALFIGHGNPMNAIEENAYSRGWKELGKKLPEPSAILSISAHWLSDGTFVHESAKPKTIHDFWGFPEDLFEVEYNCPGAPQMAGEVRSLVSTAKIEPDDQWGIDHGSWVPLRRLFPDASIPVTQLSIDISKPAQFHYELGKELAPLRDRGVLVMGSGNIVHNLGLARFERENDPYEWAVEFDALSKELISKGDHESLLDYRNLGRLALLSVPTPDHYWPLMYILGLSDKNEAVTFPVDGIAHGSVSMRVAAFGLGG